MHPDPEPEPEPEPEPNPHPHTYPHAHPHPHPDQLSIGETTFTGRPELRNPMEVGAQMDAPEPEPQP